VIHAYLETHKWITGHSADEKTFALARSTVVRYVFAAANGCGLDTDFTSSDTQAALIRTDSEPDWINGPSPRWQADIAVAEYH